MTPSYSLSTTAQHTSHPTALSTANNSSQYVRLTTEIELAPIKSCLNN